MIFDFHTHTFPDKIAGKAVDKLSHTSHTVPFSDGTVAGLLKNMARAGIDGSLILPVATSPGQVLHINDSSAKINEVYASQGLFSFGCMHPDFDGYKEELARIRRLGLKGIKLHPVYQDVDLDDIRFLRIIDCAAQEGLIVITHAGYDVGFPGVVRCSPVMVQNVLKAIGSFRFVLAHMGGWRQWDEVIELLSATDVMIDTAFSTGRMTPLKDGYWQETDLPMLDQEGFLRLLRAFGPDRILFGTDSPWSDPVESLAFLRALPLSKEDLSKILGGNACRLLFQA